MDQSLQQFSGNLLHMMRGALMMLFVLMSVGLYPRRKENPILNFLFWLLVTMSVLLSMSFGFMVDVLKDSEQFRNFKLLIDLCLIPLIGSFLLKIIVPDRISVQKILLLLTPTIAFVVIHAISNNKVMLTFSVSYTALVVAFILALIVFVSIRYDRLLKNNFSNIDNKSVGWVRIVICVFVAWYLVWGLIVKLDSRWLDSVYYLFLIIVWIFIYRYSIKHILVYCSRDLFETPQAEIPEMLKSTPFNDKLGVDLELYMNKECPWLNPSLTLQNLAVALNTNRTYLSEYFNRTLNTTFYDYLNNLRINYACEILLSKPDLSIIQVAEKSGFNSLSTFRRSFEKQMGCTPATYRKQPVKR